MITVTKLGEGDKKTVAAGGGTVGSEVVCAVVKCGHDAIAHEVSDYSGG